MIVVLDTNVVVSALLSSSGSLAKIITAWEAGHFEVATSPALLDELERVLGYDHLRKYFTQTQAKNKSLLKRFKSVGILVEPHFELEVIPEDPDDNQVLACAVAANAIDIVSDAEHLLGLKKYREIMILTPAGFTNLLALAAEQGD
jgi:putative PIN family toxin of toxin-antitoxin system